MPFHVVRRHKTGSLSDDFNDGRVGQFRSIENARGAYADQINKERRAQMRWRNEQQMRMDMLASLEEQEAQENNETSNYSSSSSYRPRSSSSATRKQQFDQPIVVRDIFGNVSSLIPKKTSAASSSKNFSNVESPARETHFVVLPKQSFLPSNIPLTTSSIAAAGGSGTAMRNGGWNFNHHRRNLDETTNNNTSSSLDRMLRQRPHSATATRRRNTRPLDSDDDDAVSVASTTLSRKEERDLLKSRLDELQSEVANGSKQRQRLENQIDELKDLIVNFKKEQSEKKKLVGTFGNLEEPVQVTYRARRAPGIKTGMSGFASSRKQDPKLH